MASLNPRVPLLYPPNQYLPGMMCKPNGSLAYPGVDAVRANAGQTGGYALAPVAMANVVESTGGR
jgi:hypothetical protein